MLSIDLQRCFSNVGARLKIRTQPKGSLVQLSLREDSAGRFFQLVLPRLSRNLVKLLAVQPRRKRLLLRLGSGDKYVYALVRMTPQIQIRTLKRREAKRLLALPGRTQRPRAA